MVLVPNNVLSQAAPVVAGSNMINVPTVVPSGDVIGSNNLVRSRSAASFYSLRVDTRNATMPQKVVLFDASGAYQIDMGFVMDPSVVITGSPNDYQAMLNMWAHITTHFDVVKMRVTKAPTTTATTTNCCCPGDATIQFMNPIEVWRSQVGRKPSNDDIIYPEKGIHEGQYHQDIVTFGMNEVIDNRTALVYTQEPGLIVTFSFYQKAELGAKI